MITNLRMDLRFKLYKISTDTPVTIHQYRKCTELICNYTNSYQRLPVLINPITVTEVTMGLVMVM